MGEGGCLPHMKGLTPSMFLAWGFGFLFVTIISAGSLIGAFVVPLMDKPLYKMTLMCMVSVAVGVLGGSGIFHLIPSVSWLSSSSCMLALK